MRRAIIVQTALVVELAILMLMLLAWGGADRREQPRPVETYRPATEQERRQAEVDRLRAELDRIAEQRAREEASQTPTGVRPGAVCDQPGQTAAADDGRVLACTTTMADRQPRWRTGQHDLPRR